MRRVFLLVLAAMVIFGLTTSVVAQRKYVIKLAHNNPASDDSLCQIGALAFKEAVERATDQIEVRIFPAGQLGDQRVMFESMQMGTLEMAIMGDAPIANWFPAINTIGIPFLFKDSQTAWKVLDGEFGQELAREMLKATGVRLLAWGENGFRHFTNSVREIRTPDDVRGLKIRVQENPMHVKMIVDMGGIPTPMAFTEVYSSLQQGVLDGQENPITIINSFRLDEVQKYLCLDGHVYATANVFISEAFYSRLPRELQEIVSEAARIGGEALRSFAVKEAEDGIGKLMERGMVVYQPTDADLGVFREVAQKPALEYLRQDKSLVPWVDKLLAAVAEAETK